MIDTFRVSPNLSGFCYYTACEEKCTEFNLFHGSWSKPGLGQPPQVRIVWFSLFNPARGVGLIPVAACFFDESSWGY